MLRGDLPASSNKFLKPLQFIEISLCEFLHLILLNFVAFDFAIVPAAVLECNQADNNNRGEQQQVENADLILAGFGNVTCPFKRKSRSGFGRCENPAQSLCRHVWNSKLLGNLNQSRNSYGGHRCVTRKASALLFRISSALLPLTLPQVILNREPIPRSSNGMQLVGTSMGPKLNGAPNSSIILKTTNPPLACRSTWNQFSYTSYSSHDIFTNKVAMEFGDIFGFNLRIRKSACLFFRFRILRVVNLRRRVVYLSC